MSEQTPQELIARPQGMVKEASVKLTDFLGRYRTQIVEILPKHLTPERVLKLIVGELNRSPSLLQCSPMSVVNCCLHAASLGIEIRPRSSYIVPFGKDAQLLLDYRAKIDLALRSGFVTDMEARLVYEGDDFNVQFGTEPKMVHVPKFQTEKVQLGYAVAWMKDARRPHVEIMSVAQIEGIRNKSRMKDGPAWKGHWDQMARKTLIHRLSNYVPLSPEMSHSQDIDDRLDTGKPLDPFFDVELQDEKPMIEASEEEQQRVMNEKLAAGREASAAKKEAKRATKKPAPETPAAPTVPVYQDWKAVPDVFDFPSGSQIRVAGRLYEPNVDVTGWNLVEQQASN